MAVAFGTATSATATSGTSVTVNVPASTANGDLLVLSVNGGSGQSAFAVTGGGWTVLQASFTDSNDTAGAIWYRVASSEPASYTVTWTTASGGTVATMRRFTGASTTTPIRASRKDAAAGVGASFTTTALSGTQTGDLTVMVALMGDDAGSTTYTVTQPGSPWTSIDSITTVRPKYQGAVYAAGSQSAATWTSSSASAIWNVVTFAIEPASGGGGGGGGSLTLTATPDPTYTPPRIRIDIADTRSSPAASLTINRTDPSGFVTPVRTADGNPLPITGGTATIWDYEAPFGAAVTYSSVEVPSVSTSPVTLAVSQVWLIHPGIPALSQPIRMRIKSLTQVVYKTTRGVFQPLGRKNPVVITDGARHGGGSSLTALVTDSASLSGLLNLLDDSSPLLLNVPATGGYTFGTCYISVGDVSTSPSVTELAVDPYIDVVMPFDVVDAPVGGSTSTRTYAVVEGAHTTYASAEAAYSTYAQAIAGP